LVTGGTTSCVLTGTTITVAKTGTCVVTATKAADDVYEAASSIPITISVTAPKPVVVVPTPVVKVSPIKHVVTVSPSGKPVLVGIQIIKPVIFGPDSAKLDAGDLKQLRAAATLAKSKNMGVLVTGFVKSAGKSTLIEKLLASSRAKNVATYLRKLGVNVAIQYAGFGAYNKLAPSSNDRRVEIRWVAND
jgi:outer membrane protein OmpA-like peptidoglycan-associated protein